MRGFQFLFAATFCAAFGIANAAGTVKTYTVEAAFAADDVIDWSVAGASDASRTLSGATSNGSVIVTATTSADILERMQPAAEASGKRTRGGSPLRSGGPLTFAFTSGPVMGVAMQIQGVTARINAYDANGNLLGAAGLTTASSFAGIRSSAKEIARVTIETQGVPYVVGNFSVALTPVIANDKFFVGQLYQDLYGRAPSAAELSEKVETLRAGTMTRAEMAAGMLTSGEFHERGSYLAKCFLALMRRDADFSRWSQIYAVMQQGATRDAALAAFLATPEYAAAYPASLSDAAFVAKIHQDMLGRQPEDRELEIWTSQIARGGSRADVVDTFLQSPQLEARLAGRINVSLCYMALLHREAGAVTANRWAAALDGGAPLTDVVNSVLSSPEYASRF